MYAEALGLNPDEVLSKDALAKPHRTVVDRESRKVQVLNEALKNAILVASYHACIDLLQKKGYLSRTLCQGISTGKEFQEPEQ